MKSPAIGVFHPAAEKSGTAAAGCADAAVIKAVAARIDALQEKISPPSREGRTISRRQNDILSLPFKNPAYPRLERAARRNNRCSRRRPARLRFGASDRSAASQ